jgi:hypothetical protein
MKALPKYKDINVSNDLTKNERARKKELSVIFASLKSCNIFSMS